MSQDGHTARLSNVIPAKLSLIRLSDWQQSQIEFWRKVEGWPYDVSSFGRVRTWKRTVRHKGKFKAVVSSEPLILKQSVKTGRYSGEYLQNVLRTSGKKPKLNLVHRLVAKAFIPNPEGLPQVNHRNGLKQDNRVDNLEWVSSKTNHIHALVNGLRVSGERSPRARLSKQQVLEIRSQAALGWSKNGMSKQYGVSRWLIRSIVKGDCWKYVDTNE